jgi:hypothetical protein
MSKNSIMAWLLLIGGISVAITIGLIIYKYVSDAACKLALVFIMTTITIHYYLKKCDELLKL